MHAKRKEVSTASRKRVEEYRPVAGEFVREADRAAEVPGHAEGTDHPALTSDDPEPGYKLPPWQAMTTYTAGARLTHDREKGVYRIHFDPKMDKVEFKAFFREAIKPLLTGDHKLKGGAVTRFFYDPANRDWEIRYRFIARDKDGQELYGEDGRKQYANFNGQVQVIAQRVTDQAAGLIAAKLGLEPKVADIPM